MSELQSAAFTLGGLALVWALIVFAIWWMRRPRPETVGYTAPRAPGESRFPKLSRKAEPDIEPVEISASRLARISGRSAPGAPDEAPSPWAPEQGEPAGVPLPPVAEALAADGNPPAATEEAPQPAAEPLIAEPVIAEPAIAEPIGAAPAVADAPFDEATLDALASEVEQRAHGIGHRAANQPSVRLVPQIPPRDAIFRTSWLGGRPHLPADMAWPQVDGSDGDFLAQIACADLPHALWEGLGPRTGWLAFFSNPDTGAATAVHLHDDGPPRDPPRAAGAAYFHPYGVDSADLMPLAIRAFPEWPVDVVTVEPGTADPDYGSADDAAALLTADYDIADPAFHPFDWPTMLALAEILESRIAEQPLDGAAPGDASDELALAIGDAAAGNTDAAQRAGEIIAIIREGAEQGVSFSPPDATAVMAGLHAIRWTRVWTVANAETGEDLVETITLPLTRHRPDGDLWVDDYRTILFDHAKHAWCRHPATLSAPARAFFEPLWQAMADREIAAMGNFPSLHAVGFDDERDTVMLEFPAGGLMSRGTRDGGNLVFAIRKADLAAGDFAKMRALSSH